MDDFISREAAIKEFCDDCMDREWCKSNGESCSRIKNINAVPAADVRPVRKGHYILDDMGDSSCSECGEKYLDITKRFCPECGAELRRADNADNSNSV